MTNESASTYLHSGPDYVSELSTKVIESSLQVTYLNNARCFPCRRDPRHTVFFS